MEDPASSHSASAKSKKKGADQKEKAPKKSKPGRIYLWLGIVILLGVVLLEGSSRGCYETSYKSLETAINAPNASGTSQGIPISEVDKHLSGYFSRSDKMIEERIVPARGEPFVTRKRRLIYKWPSIFRRYEFRLTIEKDDRVIFIESSAASADK